MAQTVKNPSAVQETSVRSLGQEDPLEMGIDYPLQCSWASLVAQLVKNPPAMCETWVQSWVGKVLWRTESLPTPVFWPGESHGQRGLEALQSMDSKSRT